MWQLMLSRRLRPSPGVGSCSSQRFEPTGFPQPCTTWTMVYEENRTDLVAVKRPSEYWRGKYPGRRLVPSTRRGKSPMRHEIGVKDTIAFGRDYPHPEGTWPNTKDWLPRTPSAAFPRTRSE